jgi:hypothetical protein
MNTYHYYWPHKIVENMSRYLIDLINEAKKNNTPCRPKHQILPESFVLDEKHYDWVLEFCSHILVNEDNKSMDMARKIAAENEDKNGMIHHNGLEAIAPFVPFFCSDENIK